MSSNGAQFDASCVVYMKHAAAQWRVYYAGSFIGMIVVEKRVHHAGRASEHVVRKVTSPQLASKRFSSSESCARALVERFKTRGRA